MTRKGIVTGFPEQIQPVDQGELPCPSDFSGSLGTGRSLHRQGCGAHQPPWSPRTWPHREHCRPGGWRGERQDAMGLAISQHLLQVTHPVGVRSAFQVLFPLPTSLGIEIIMYLTIPFIRSPQTSTSNWTH